jgi:hypothetical protein
MTLSRDLSSSSFYLPRRVSADLCLHVATLRRPASFCRISHHPFAHRTPSHDSNFAVPGILSLVLIVKTPFNTQ